MRPLPFVWPYALGFWLVVFWAFSVEFAIVQRAQRPAAAPQSPDAGSLRVIMIGQWIGMLLAFSILLVEAIGEPYAAFMKTRKRFIPFIV